MSDNYPNPALIGQVRTGKATNKLESYIASPEGFEDLFIRERKPDLITPGQANYIAKRHSEMDPVPLYRAQYECRHCLEQYEDGPTLPLQQIVDTYEKINSTAMTTKRMHNCTPDIIGVADLQCFVKQ